MNMATVDRRKRKIENIVLHRDVTAHGKLLLSGRVATTIGAHVDMRVKGFREEKKIENKIRKSIYT